MNCDACGSEMQLRTNRANGDQFWGCPNYQNCGGKAKPAKNVTPQAPKPVEANNFAQAGSKKEFHLPPEQVRHNAMEIALTWRGRDSDYMSVLNLAKQIEQYYWTGE